jgi:hypothetical protein
MSNIKKKHHYLTKYYLEGFCDNNGKIWTYSKIDPNTPSPNLPEETAVIHKFYWLEDYGKVNEVEDWLEKEVETPVADLFKELRSKKIPDTAEKKLLSFFFGTLIARTPSRINWLKDILEKDINFISSKLTSNNDSLKIHKNNLLEKMVFMCGEYAELLYAKNWCLIETNDEYPFFTSDNLMNIFNPNIKPNTFYQPGLGMPDTRIFVPISKNLSLFLTNDPNFSDGKIYSICKNNYAAASNKTNIKKLIKLLNKAVYINSNKYVFASSNSDKLKNCFNNLFQKAKLKQHPK